MPDGILGKTTASAAPPKELRFLSKVDASVPGHANRPGSRSAAGPPHESLRHEGRLLAKCCASNPESSSRARHSITQDHHEPVTRAN